MKFKFFTALLMCLTLALTSCTEHYSDGVRMGFVTKVSRKGLIFSTFEGKLTMSSTNMGVGETWDFSVEVDSVVDQLVEAAKNSSHVKLTYHEVTGTNWFSYRGETNYFVTKVELIDTMNKVVITELPSVDTVQLVK